MSRALPKTLDVSTAGDTDGEAGNGRTLAPHTPTRVLRVLEIVERRKITNTLTSCDGNRTRAAEQLGISTKTLLAKTRELGLE